MQDQVNQVLDHFKPFFHAHSGDFEVKEVTDDGCVKIQLIGDCVLCSLKEKTAAGMEDALKKAIPGITAVELV